LIDEVGPYAMARMDGEDDEWEIGVHLFFYQGGKCILKIEDQGVRNEKEK